jgi:carboxymethylenebutenolidase
LFYGTGELTGYDKSQSKFLGHFAEKDPYEQEEYIRKLEQNLRSTGKEVSFYFYPGTGHWFFENDRDDAYDNEAANLAWTRTLKFLETELK